MSHLIFISATIDEMIRALSWTLIHSLWQGLLLSIILGVILMVAKRSSAARRYNLALSLFLLFCGICSATFIWEYTSSELPEAAAPFSGISVGFSNMFTGNMHDIREVIDSFNHYFSANAPLIALAWFTFFIFKSVKMIASLVYNQRIMTRQVCEPGETWTKVITGLSEKLQIKKTVKLLQSGYIKMPVVIGYLKPVILIPAGLLSGLPTEQVEAILLHELAHVRRNDYLINFLQNIAETVFFFNPGLLWISSLLREERENCCDDIALSQTKNKRDLVQALVSFKEYELYGTAYATAFAGKKNYLLHRVTRILDDKSKKMGASEKVFFAINILIFCVILTAATVAQIGEYATTMPVRNNYMSDKIIPSGLSAINKTAVKKLKVVAKNVKTGARQKVVIALPGIKEIKEPEEIDTKKQAALEAAQLNSKRAEFADEQNAIRDQMQARIDEDRARKDQQQAMLNQLQAKKDWQQALKDAAMARLSEAQAKQDQEHAIKEKADADAEKINLNMQH